MERESSLPYSQAPATCPYPEPTPSSPHNPFHFLKIDGCTIYRLLLVLTQRDVLYKNKNKNSFVYNLVITSSEITTLIAWFLNYAEHSICLGLCLTSATLKHHK